MTCRCTSIAIDYFVICQDSQYDQNRGRRCLMINLKVNHIKYLFCKGRAQVGRDPETVGNA